MTQQINLFNPVLLKQKKHFSAITMAQALGLILFGTLVMSGFSAYRLSALGKQANAVSAQRSAAQAELSKIAAEAAKRQKSKELENEVRKAEEKVSSMQQSVNSLQNGGVGSMKGYSEYFKALSRQAEEGLWLTDIVVSGGGNELDMRGGALRAELVPALIERLRNEPVMRGKSFAMLEMSVPEKAADSGTGAHVSEYAAPRFIEFSLQSSEQAGTAKAGVSGARPK